LHQHGLVHRDIKPSNVLFVNGVPKLGDIGLVTETGDTHSIVGTEGYLPPEGPGAPQADIFSLGKVLYEISTGMDRRRFSELPEDLRLWPTERSGRISTKSSSRPARKTQHGVTKTADGMYGDLALLKSGQSVRHLRTVERRLKISYEGSRDGWRVRGHRGRHFLRDHPAETRSHCAAWYGCTSPTEESAMDNGDLFGSLLSFTEALRLDAGNDKREESIGFGLPRSCVNAPSSSGCLLILTRRSMTRPSARMAGTW